MVKNIAVLMTCHNRREKTLECLGSLFRALLPNNYKLKVFVVDDGSTDRTGDYIRKDFPKVNLIKGSGFLFWNQGMRLAWENAVKTKKYDFYVWLNDDTILDNQAIVELINCHFEVLKIKGVSSLITGACRSSNNSFEFSYGGRTKRKEPVLPNGEIQSCEYINGNIVLVPKNIYEELGNLSPHYTHAFGDFDYGLRSIEAGYENYTTSQYIATCASNNEFQWSDPNLSLSKRLKLFKSPKGLNFSEYIIFIKRFWGPKWVVFAIKAYVKVLFPSFYKILLDNK